MSASISPVQYFYANVTDRPGEAYGFLSTLAGSGVNLLAFNAIPLGWNTTQLALFPEDAGALAAAMPRLLQLGRLKPKGKKLGFVALRAEDERSYHLRAMRNFTSALTESLSSLDMLADSLTAAADVAAVNAAYRRLSTLLEQV